MNYEILTRMKE